MVSYPAIAQALFEIRGTVMPLWGMPARETVHVTAVSRHDALNTARQLRGNGLVVEITGPDGKVVDEQAAE